MNKNTTTFLNIITTENPDINAREEFCKDLIEIIKVSDLEIGGLSRALAENKTALNNIEKLFVTFVYNLTLLPDTKVNQRNEASVILSKNFVNKLDIFNIDKIDLTSVFGYGGMLTWYDEHPDITESITGSVLRSGPAVQQNWLRILIRLMENNPSYQIISENVDTFLPLM